MKFHQPTAEIFVPDGLPDAPALERITHLGIGAHPDDLEFMAFHGILECYGSDRQWFGGVTCTNGSGSARTGDFKNFSDADMIAVRRREQNVAAIVGKYGVMIQLDYSNGTVKSATDMAVKSDLKKILSAAKPEIVYTHNPADKHDADMRVIACNAAMTRISASSSLRYRRCANCRIISVQKKSGAAKSGATSTGCPMPTRC